MSGGWLLFGVSLKAVLTSGYSQCILVQISGIFMMLLEFWQDVVLHEPCQCQSSVRREWNLISQCIFSLCQVAQLVSVSFDSIAGCAVLVELSFNWIFVLLFPLIHLKNNQQICFCKLP